MAASRFTFDQVIQCEQQVIADQRRNRGLAPASPAAVAPVLGLALSGGGIRSASFALGVLQCLHNDGLLKHFDYLSTVSGGGYIGGSLTWFHHQQRRAAHAEGDAAAMQPQEYQFPFGRKYFVRRAMDSGSHGAASGKGATEEAADNTAFLRQLGNYLSHGAEVSTMSLLAVLLRNVSLAFIVYFALLLAGTLIVTPLFGDSTMLPALLLLLAFLLSCVFYGWASFAYSKYLPESVQLYRWRIRSQRWQGSLLTLVVLCLIGGSIPGLYGLIKNWQWTGFLSLSGTGIGAVLLEILKQRRPQLATTLGRYGNLLALVGAAAMIYALLFAAYVVSLRLEQQGGSGWWPALLIGGSVAVGGFLNLNLFGLGRMYRDRLMETFMPNRVSVAQRHWALATEADVTFLKDVCDARDYGPYLIINSNVVLTASQAVEYRGRGGDNFTMSSQFCGGDALGWHRTADFIGGSMSLATAVAISGAALNPNAACAGAGITRSRLSSFLLGLFNLRLGYWVRNPIAPAFAAKLAKRLWPNFIYPGIRQGLLGAGLHERAGFVQLTDGGHFENTGIYELIRRGADLIVLSLASADEHYRYEDLADVIERVRVDFGVYIHFSDALRATLPHAVSAGGLESALRLSDRAHAVASIEYPDNGLYQAAHGAQHKVGKLVVLKSAILSGLPLDVVAYGASHPDFPNQSTADQYFDERQFEAYRGAGYAACKAMLMEKIIPLPGVVQAAAGNTGV